jgi:EpsI family protein
MKKPQTIAQSPMVKWVVTVILLLSAAGINYTLSKPDIALPRKNLSEFPQTLGDWRVVNEQTIDSKSMAILLADDYLMRTYQNSRGESIGLYIGYFKSQREGKQVHSPRQCLPGGGWMPVSSTVYQMPLPNHNPATVPVNKQILGKGADHQLYLYWYQGRGRIYDNEYWNKIYLIWDGLSKKRTDGALIRINSSITLTPETSLRTQIEFIQQFSFALGDFIPN